MVSPGLYCLFVLLQVADDNGFRRPYFMLIMMGISFGAIVNTFTLFPKYKVSPVTGLPITSNAGSTAVLEEPPVSTMTAVPPGLSTSNSLFVSDISPSSEVQVKERKNDDSFLSSLTSVLYLTHLYWFAISHLRVHYFVGSFNALVTSVTGGDEERGKLACCPYRFANRPADTVSSLPSDRCMVDSGRQHPSE